MAKVWDNEITKSTDWGGDESTGNIPVSGKRVQEFIKNTFNTKVGVFYYDAANNRYLVFADEDAKNSYIINPTQIELILGTFDAPFNYSAEIHLTSPTYVAILVGSVGNYIDFTFDTKNKQGLSVGEDVLCTYTFIRGSVKKTITQKYRYGVAVHFNIDEYLEAGMNTITVGIVGQNTLAATTAAITYQVIDLRITDSFDISGVFNLAINPDSSLAIPYTVSGTGVKTMEWYIDGEKQAFNKNEDEIVEISSTRTKYLSIAGLSQGRHDIQFRASTIINEEVFYSETLYRDFMVYRIEDLKEIIAVAVTLPISQDIIVDDNLVIQGITQYIPYELRFATFNPSASTSDVQILVDDVVVASILSNNGEVNSYNLLLTTSGKKALKIRTESSEYVIPIEVKESDTSLSEIMDGLQLDLQATGKTNNAYDKDSWTYGNYETTFSGFAWNKISGWVNNRLLISNNARIDINIAPLSEDILILGKTLEFEFATKNVSDDNAVVCDLRNSNGVGLLITASEATLTSAGGAKLTTKYKSEENIRISFVINKKSGSTNKLIAFIYINGVVSGAVNFAATDSFISDKQIRISSTSDVDIELKQLRFYDVALTSDQILNNYILYRDTAQELLSIFDRNNIYADDGYSFSPDILSGQLPIMIVTGNIPALENTTDKNLEIVVDVEYTNLQDPSRSFSIKNGIMRPQGTSSMSYPKKNFRLYTQRRDDTILYDSEGRVVSNNLYAFKQGSQPVNCWCMKADYAESSGTHNTGIARLWNDVMRYARIGDEYVCRTTAQKMALENEYPYDVRTTIDGFPILMFYRLTAEDDLVFIGKYNFNNDKSTESVFGFKGIPGFNNNRMQCWEVLNNGHHLALFQDVNNFDAEWGDAFESRYPDVGSAANTADLKAFATWLVSTKNNLEKFKAEKAQHLDLYKMAAYYIYFMRFGAVDQTVKNAMFTSEDGEHFYYINYDNDTINGVRNDGLLIYPPTIDRQSLDDTFSTTVYAYAGHDSTLWNNLEADEEFMRMVSEVDNALFAAGLSYANVIDMFDNKQCNIWCERVYNQDSQYKYIGPYTDSGVNNLYMLQGKRQSHRRWWLSRRFNFLDSKFVSGDYKSNTFEIKVAGAPIGVEFSLTAGFDMDYGYGVNNVPIETGVSLVEGQSHTFTTKQVLNIGDPLRIYSAVNLKEVDVHNFIEYMSTVTVDKVYNEVLGTKLKRLILGVDVSSDGRRNTSISEISGLQAAKRLEYLDISGYKGITTLDLTPFNYFTTLKAFQSGLTSVNFGEGSLLSLAELPETLQALTLISVGIKQANLKIENTWGSIRYMEIKDCPNFERNFDYFQKWYREKSSSDAESTLIVHGINWSNIIPSDLIELGQLKVNGGTLELKGRIKLTESSQEIVSTLRDIFGSNCFNPLNDLYISAPAAIYLTGPTELYEGDSAQYTAAVFSEYLGTVSYSAFGGDQSQYSMNDVTGLLTTTEKGEDSIITVRVIHRPTQGVPTQKDLTVNLKRRIYPSLTIQGESFINKQYQTYKAVENLDDYNGVYSLKWSLSGEAYSEGFIRISSQSGKTCIIELVESSVEIKQATLTVTMTKGYGGTQKFTKTIDVVEEGVIMTSTSQPRLMARCHEMGWTLSPDKMMKDEAAAVTDINSNFFYFERESFHEFQYFTGITQLTHANVFDGNCGGLTFPDSLTFAKDIFGSNFFVSELDLKNLEKSDLSFRFRDDTNNLKIIVRKNLIAIGSNAITVRDSSSANKVELDIYSTELVNFMTIIAPTAKIEARLLANDVKVSTNAFYASFVDGRINLKLINSERISYLARMAIRRGIIVEELKLGAKLELESSIYDTKICKFVQSGSSRYTAHSDGLILMEGNAVIGFAFIDEDIPSLRFPDNATTVKRVSYTSGSYIDYKHTIDTLDLNNVSVLEDYAFYMTSSIKNVNAPNLVSAGSQAFSNCKNMESINAPLLKEFSPYLFSYSGLKSIDLSGVTIIGMSSLSNTEITELTIPSGLESFGPNNIQTLESIISHSEKFRVVNDGYFLVEGIKVLLITFCKEGEITIPSGYDYNDRNWVNLNSPCNFTGITYDIEIDVSNTVYFAYKPKLKTIKFNKNISAPTTRSDSFGTREESYTGRDTYNQGVNKIIVPENATGFDEGYWLSTLCNPDRCGFVLEKSLPAVETIETLSAKNNLFMAFARTAINTMSLSDEVALEYKDIYPKWEDVIGGKVEPKFRLREGVYPNDKLYEVVQAHTVSSDWVPSKTPSLYKAVAKDPDTGTADNPIEWSKGMELVEGKYYKDKGVTYLCIRNSGIPMNYDLADLVSGGFVRVSE